MSDELDPKHAAMLRHAADVENARSELGNRQDWRLHEFLLWLGLRNPDRVAEFLVGAGERWSNERGDVVCAELAFLFNPQGGHDWSDNPPAEFNPASAATRQLRDGVLVATALTGPEGARRVVPAEFYIDGHLCALPGFRVRQSEVIQIWPRADLGAAVRKAIVSSGGGEWILRELTGDVESVDPLERAAELLIGRTDPIKSFDERLAEANTIIDACARPGRTQWRDDYIARPIWSLCEVLAWVGLRDASRVSAQFGPRTIWAGVLTMREGVSLDLCVGHLESIPDAARRYPRETLLQEIQRDRLRLADEVAGGHARHRLRDLQASSFYRTEVMEIWPPIAPAEACFGDDSDDAVDATIRLLSKERASPLPRNEGSKVLKKLHPSRTTTALKARIRAVFPMVNPGPKGPRNRAAKLF